MSYYKNKYNNMNLQQQKQVQDKNRKQNVVLRSLTKFGIRTDISKPVCEGWIVRDTMSALE